MSNTVRHSLRSRQMQQIFNSLLELSIDVLLELTLMMHRCFGWAAFAHAQELDGSLDVGGLIDPKGSFSPITSYVHT